MHTLVSPYGCGSDPLFPSFNPDSSVYQTSLTSRLYKVLLKTGSTRRRASKIAEGVNAPDKETQLMMDEQKVGSQHTQW